MNKHRFSLAALALCALAAAATSHAVTFRVVSSMNGYQYPSALLEGSPGLFFASATLAGTSQQAAMSITNTGVVTVLATLPNMYAFLSGFAGGPNSRFYTGVEYSSYPGYAFSVTSAPGSGQSYPPGSYTPVFWQSLPNARFLATGGGGKTGNLYLQNIDLAGNVTPVYRFSIGTRPLFAIYASDGNYYGIAAVANSPASYVFRITPTGSGTTFYSFPPNTFTAWTPSPLVQSPQGIFYGALPSGGANAKGLIFKLTLSGKYTPLYTFRSSDNGGPTSLIQASDGNLYGAAVNSGGNSYLFRVTPAGQYSTIHTMSPGADGICFCTLVQGSDGIVYGTATAGGPYGGGTLFALNAGLPKPKPRALQFTPQSGPVGTQVQIWGYNLLAPSVQFNGVADSTTTSSGPQYVLARVPTGATSGPITVTTPGGSYTTKSSFTVQ